MILVKLTALLIVVTFIVRFFVKVAIDNASLTTKARILNGKYPWYYFLLGTLIILDFMGIIYTVVYFLFIR